jgi:hypothetical protein
LLANELIGQMWVGSRDGATLQSTFETGGAAYTPWAARVAATLPGVTTTTNQPTVVVVPGVVGPPQTSSTVTVIVRWQAPNEMPTPLNPTGTVHTHRVVVQII